VSGDLLIGLELQERLPDEIHQNEEECEGTVNEEKPSMNMTRV
jgi:hypothetical protein